MEQLIFINLIMTVMLINGLTTLFGWVFNMKIDRSSAFCGLFGYSGSQPPELDKIKILGMYNTGRGEDSCGISIDHKLYKGINSEANFFEFIEGNILPTPSTNICVGHTRKSTIGAKDVMNA